MRRDRRLVQCIARRRKDCAALGANNLFRKMIRKANQRGQAVVELAFQIPLMVALLFAGVQIARVFYVYHTLQKALRGGAGMLARSVNVDYCDSADAALADARNFIVFGNLQGEGTPIVQGLTTDMIQIFPERSASDPVSVTECFCTAEDAGSCDTSAGGHPPDYVVVKLVDGFPLAVPFSYVHLDAINLTVS